jgi:hypothetical protein
VAITESVRAAISACLNRLPAIDSALQARDGAEEHPPVRPVRRTLVSPHYLNQPADPSTTT